ncbi:AAA family ATPase (plasmid) [Leisingera caerulea]|uniref:endopeptidase La n=1 Tax=Leisingera caerulea TaxID=506591 RepID=A0ABY5X3Z9_LEICA|nr:ATP-binding protein [Leisingera caerulea]UWQ60985.1 AAA family ATPase [Leisingera caerulea]
MAGNLGPDPLTAAELRPALPSAKLRFTLTDELDGAQEWLGQDRAVDAIRMSATVPHEDFHVFVLGQPGSGRHVIAQSILAGIAKDRPVACDWVYVNNFEQPHKPVAIQLPPGSASRLRKMMETLVDDLANQIPALFESEDYQTRRRTIEEDFSAEHEGEMAEIFDDARARNVAILRTPVGFSFAGQRDGNVLTQEDFEALTDEEREELEAAIDSVQQRISDVLKSVPRREKEHRRQVEQLNYQLAARGVDEAIREVLDAFAGEAEVQAYLKAVRSDLVENAELFLMGDSDDAAGPFPVATSKRFEEPQFQRYRVNVMVSNGSGGQGAPVVKEELPTMANLIGRIEYASEMGALITNFTMIKPGALHRANGGYLVLDVRQVLSEPLAWDALKRCLRTGEIAIYSPGERLSLVSTVSLEPDPVPLRVRVVLIGERLHYYLLSALDPDFLQLFKLEADFDDHLRLEESGAVEGYAQLIARLARRAGTRPLDQPAVESVMRESMRLSGDTERLTLNFSRLSDLLREAEFWAGSGSSAHIGPQHIEKAVAEKERRAGRVRELGLETIRQGTVMIDTDGARIGQINALSVLQIGDYSFGKPSRLTARTRPGTGKLVDIERETELGGPIHSKGMLILQGYLAATYATRAPLSLWASLVFEQSYGGVEGDSASAAELIALLSSLAEVPLDQSFAITGSVNQFGDIQAIGGVNQKIEGFFDVCDARGLTGRQGVLIPAANVRNLTLRQRVVDAVEAGRFRVIPMTSVTDGLTVLTGLEAGERGADGTYPEGSLNRRVEDRLQGFADIRKSFAKEAGGDAE